MGDGGGAERAAGEGVGEGHLEGRGAVLIEEAEEGSVGGARGSPRRARASRKVGVGAALAEAIPARVSVLVAPPRCPRLAAGVTKAFTLGSGAGTASAVKVRKKRLPSHGMTLAKSKLEWARERRDPPSSHSVGGTPCTAHR